MSSQRRIAYLLSQYPAVSHTFFLNEVLAMRERGLEIETASINSISPPEDGFSGLEMEESARTFYVKAISKSAAVRQLVMIAVAYPGVLFRGLREALRLAPGELHGSVYALLYLAEALLVGAWMRERGCEHLHVHFSGPVATVGLLTSVAWDVPYSMTVHGPDEFYDVEKFYLKKKIERASFVVCISWFCRSQLMRISPPAVWEKLIVCRLGVDEKAFMPPTQRVGEAAVTRLICVGRLHPSKGQAVLIEALAALKQGGYAVHLDLVGGGADRAHLEDLIAKKGLLAHVTLHGATSHARTRVLLQSADLFVLASFAEGVPVSLMEAMAMEIACISSFVAGIPELIEPGRQGLLVPASSVEDLKNAIARLIDEPERRRELAREGRAKVLARYNQARNADRLVDVFRTKCAKESSK